MDSAQNHPPPFSTDRFLRILLALSGALLLFGLAVIALSGRFTRFHADDFCLAGEVVQRGLPVAQGYWYNAWSGRYSATLIASLLTLPGPGFAPFPALLVMGVWLFGLTWSFKQLGEWLDWPRPWLPAMLLALVGVFAVLSSTPNRYQSFNWLTGLTTYTLPLALLSLGSGWILYQALQRNRKPTALLLAANGLLAFFLGGFSETYVAVQVTLFGLAAALALVSGRSRTRVVLLPVLIAWLVGSLAALGGIALAPGNAARQAQLPLTPDLLRILTFSARNAAHIIGKFLLRTPLAAGISLLVPLALGLGLPGRSLDGGKWDHLSPRLLWRFPSIKGLVLAPLAGFALLTAACAPTVFAMNAYPDDRVIVAPQFFLALAVMVCGFLFGRALRDTAHRLFWKRQPTLMLAAAALALLVSGAATVQSVQSTLAQWPEAQSYAVRWDARNRDLHTLRLLEASKVEIGALESRFALADLNADPNDWVNRCFARYYGFDEVRGK